MRNITKIKRSIHAISPVISVLLMIAIAVVASLVAYAWVMGYMGFQTAKVGQAIQIPSYAEGEDVNHMQMRIYVQNVGEGTVTVGNVYVNDALVTVNSPANLDIGKGETKELIVTLNAPWQAGEQVEIKVVTTSGTFMEVKGTGPSGSSNGPQTPVYTITSSVTGTGGTIDPLGSNPVTQGADKTFTITPEEGYRVADVLVDSVSEGAISSRTFTNVQAAHTIVASFSVITYNIAVSFGSGGSITPAGPLVNVNYGADQGFTIEADNGYHIVDVLADSISVGGSGLQTHTYTFTDVQDDHAISATFAINTNTLTVNPPAGSGSGTVDLNPSGGTYSYGTVVTLTANAAANSDFAGWSGDLAGTTNPQQITMDGPKTVTATFNLKQYTLTVNVVGTGCSVTKTPDQATYAHGTVVTLDPQAAAGWTFQGWSGALTGNADPAQITMDGPKTVTATFITAPPVLHHFAFDTITGTKTAGTAFSITIRAIDQYGNAFTSYTGTNSLTVSSGTMTPTTTGAFSNGVRTMDVTLYTTGTGITIGTTGDAKTGTSNGITLNAGSGTFGNTAAGSSSYQRSIEDTIVGSIFTTPGYSVTAQSISAYVHVTDNYNMKAAIYTTDGNLVGTVGTQQVSVTTSTDDQFVLFNYASGTKPTLAANTQYVIVVWAEGHWSDDAYIRGSSSSGNSRYEDNRSYSGTFPSSVGTWSGTDTDLYSIYCTYSIP